MKNSPYLDQIRDIAVLQKLVNEYESTRSGEQRPRALLAARVQPGISLVDEPPRRVADMDRLGFRLGAKPGRDPRLKRVEGGLALSRV